MSRRRRPATAHIVLMSLAVDAAFAARPTPASAAAIPPPALSQTAPIARPDGCDEALSNGTAPLTTTSRAHLWPPNHALVDVGITVDATAACAGTAAIRVSAWSDEADDAPTGDGVTIGDARFDVPDLFLRAERAGDGDGRVYLVITRAATGTAEGSTCRTVV